MYVQFVVFFVMSPGRRSLEASLEVPNDTDDISAEALDTLLLTHALEKAQEEEQGSFYICITVYDSCKEI